MFTYVYALLAGMVFGSFYGNCDESSARESIITPRSYCHYCKYVLKPKELIPIISFVYKEDVVRIVRGKFQFCT